MASFFGRLASAIGTGGLSEWGRLIGGGGGGGNRRQQNTYNEYTALGWDPSKFNAAGGWGNPNNPYDPSLNLADSGIYDQFGFTRKLPGPNTAAEVQHGGEIVAARHNDLLARTAQQNAIATLGSAVENTQVYRPGGAAALLSPYYSNLAQTYMTTAQMRQQQAPDQMFRYNEEVRSREANATKRAGTINAITGLVGAGIGAITGGAFSPRVSLGGGAADTGGAAGEAAGGAAAGAAFGGGAASGPSSGIAGGVMQGIQGGGFGTPLVPPVQLTGGNGPLGPTTGGGVAPQAGGAPGGQPGAAGQPGAPGAPGAPGTPSGGGPRTGGGAGPSAAGGGGGGFTGTPVGPVTDMTARQMGVDPAVLSSFVAPHRPDVGSEFAARLALIMARDPLFGGADPFTTVVPDQPFYLTRRD